MQYQRLLLLVALTYTTSACAADDVLRRCGQIPHDIERLACFDALVPVDGHSVPNDPVKEAVDNMLARTLVDPKSAIDYAVSDVLPCASVSDAWDEYPDHQCVCYSVNAKNRMGGYTGGQLGYSSLMQKPGDVWFARDGNSVSDHDGIDACEAANLQSRPARLIADKVPT